MAYSYQYYLIKIIHFIQVPSFALYLAFLYVLIRHRSQLKSSFYSICMSLGVADVLYVIVSTGHRFILSEYPAARLWSASTRQMYTLIQILWWNVSYFSQVMGILVLTVNRFSAIMAPMRYKIFWGRRFTLPIALMCQWLPSIIYTPYFLFHPRMKLERTNETDLGFTVRKEGRASALSVLVPALFVISALIIIMYILMFFRIVFHRRRLTVLPTDTEVKVSLGTAAERKREKVRERKLALVGLVLGLSIIYFAFANLVGLLERRVDTPNWVREVLASFGGRSALTVYWSPIADLVFTFSNPYLVLVTSSQCRKAFFGLFPVGIRRLANRLNTTKVAPTETMGTVRFAQSEQKTFTVTPKEK